MLFGWLPSWFVAIVRCAPDMHSAEHCADDQAGRHVTYSLASIRLLHGGRALAGVRKPGVRVSNNYGTATTECEGAGTVHKTVLRKLLDSSLVYRTLSHRDLLCAETAFRPPLPASSLLPD